MGIGLKYDVSIHRAVWPFITPFRISGKEFRQSETVVLEIGCEGKIGRGEGVGVYYLDDTVETIRNELEKVRSDIERGVTLEEAQQLLPPGGARNALDCALWDLEAQRTGKSIWELTGIAPKAETRTVYTIGIEETPEEMGRKAGEAAAYPILKIKLDAKEPIERLTAIRSARPDAILVVDANQGFSAEQLEEILPGMAELGVAMLEQPLPRGDDDALETMVSPIDVCADESCLHTGELPAALSKYSMINIKLDKTGGLTNAIKLARMAREAGKKVMVGNMSGTSLSMCPSFVIAQLCDFVDIDGPLLLSSDYLGGLSYSGAQVKAPNGSFWGNMHLSPGGAQAK